MPIHKTASGYKWGEHGATYPTREGAEKQAAAAYANGYKGYSEGGEVTGMKELHRKIIQACLDHEMEGAAHDVVSSVAGHEMHDLHTADKVNARDKSLKDDSVHEGNEDVLANDKPEEKELPVDEHGKHEQAEAGEVVPHYADESVDNSGYDQDEEDEETKRIVAAFAKYKK